MLVVAAMEQMTQTGNLATVTTATRKTVAQRGMVAAPVQRGRRERRPEAVEVVERESRERYKDASGDGERQREAVEGGSSKRYKIQYKMY